MGFSVQQLNSIVDDLRSLPRETEWVEFKVNNAKPETIGENISALSNAAALHGKERAFIVFGVEDDSHRIEGTTVDLHAEKVGGEELENWLSTQLDPRINVEFYDFEYVPGTKLALIAISAALGFPVSFKGTKYVRVGSYTKKLAEYKGKEKALWAKLENRVFELGIAATDLTRVQALELLDYGVLFRRLKIPIPESPERIIEKLIEEELVISEHSKYSITNMGAIRLIFVSFSLYAGKLCELLSIRGRIS
jgi:ATP-dependent DNA helicase RecG